jgi:hypothetical protein
MKTFQNAFFYSPALVSSISLILLLGAGCGDSREVAELKTKIEAMATKQRELDSKLAAMGEKIVTKAIEVQGPVQAKSAEIDLIQATKITASYSLRVSAKDSNEGHTLIYPWSLQISSIRRDQKNGHISTLDSASLSIRDYEGDFSGYRGNGIVLGVKGKRNIATRSDPKENKLEIWSVPEESDFPVIRNLWNEVPVKTSTTFASRNIGKGVGYISEAQDGYGKFGVEIMSISEDGIVRIQIANVAALNVTGIVGVLEWYGSDGTKETKFMIDRTMETGVWESVSVPTGVSRERIFFLTVHQVRVQSTFFRR